VMGGKPQWLGLVAAAAGAWAQAAVVRGLPALDEDDGRGGERDAADGRW
jgi:hypothetical protein